MSSGWISRRSGPYVLSGLLLASGASAQERPAAELAFTPAYATFFGGSEREQAREVIPDADGAALVGGQTASTNLPTTPGVVQPRYAGDDPKPGQGGIFGGDLFLMRLSPDGKTVLAATYFGGSKQERNAYGMALDRAGNIVVSTATRSPDLPTTPGVWRPAYHGGAHDTVAAKLTPDLGRILWCTYLGGYWGRGGLELDPEDNILLGGVADKADFPTTPGAFQEQPRGPKDSALLKLRADASGVIFATRLGGSATDDAIMGMRLGAGGAIYASGHGESADFPFPPGAAQSKAGGKWDSYVVKFSPDGGRLLYGTYLGGSENEFAEHRVRILADGSVLATGATASPDFPTTKGAYQRTLHGKTDGFLAKVSPDGTTFAFSTYYGGSGNDFWLMPTVDAEGRIYIVGQTTSRDLPVTPGALQPRYGGGESDGALAVFSPDGSQLLYATYLGGHDEDMVRGIALGPRGEVYLTGHTGSPDFPVTAGAAQAAFGGVTDAFVVKLIRR